MIGLEGPCITITLPFNSIFHEFFTELMRILTQRHTHAKANCQLIQLTEIVICLFTDSFTVDQVPSDLQIHFQYIDVH